MEPHTHNLFSPQNLFYLWPHNLPFSNTHHFSCSACMLMLHLEFFFNFPLDQCEFQSFQSKCQPSCLQTHTHTHIQHTWCPVLLAGSHCPRTPYLHRQASQSRLTMEPFWKQTPPPPPLRAHRKGKHRGSCSAPKQPWQNILTGWCLLVLPGDMAEQWWGDASVSPAFVTRFSHFRAEFPAAARVKWWWRCPPPQKKKPVFFDDRLLIQHS